MWIGSCNHTDASMRNVELGVILNLSENDCSAEYDRFEALWGSGRE